MNTIMLFGVLCLAFLCSCIVYTQPPPSVSPSTTQQGSPQNLPSQPDKTNTDSTPSNISEVIAFCRRVQGAEQIPLSCSLEHIRGQLTIVVTFANPQTFQRYATEVVEYIGVPLCLSATRANRQAFLIFSVYSTRMSKIYSCEEGEGSEWFSWDQLKKL